MSAHAAAPRAELAAARILIVEDDPSYAALLCTFLRDEPYALTVAASVADANDALAERPDLCLVDHNLVGGTAKDVIAAAASLSPDTRFVFLTGSSRQEIVSEAFHLGVDDFLIKQELREEQLAAAIRSALERGRLERGRQEAERRLAASEARYRQLVESLAGFTVFHVDHDLRILNVGGPAIDGLGWDVDELVGRVLEDVLPPEAFDDIAARYRAALAGEPQLFERMSAKGTRLVSVRIEPVRGATGEVESVIAVSQDITAHRAQAELQSRAAAIVAATGDALTSTALDGTVLTWNAGAERIYGVKAEEIVGKHASLVAGSESDAPSMSFVERIASGEELIEAEVQRTRPDGTPIVLELRLAPLRDHNGVTYGVMSMTRDVTEKRAMEERLRAAERLQSLVVLAGGVAHQFNNLLAAILGHTALARSDAGPESPLRDSLDAIEEAAKRAAELTRQLIAYVGKTQLERRPLDLAAVAREACAAASSRAKKDVSVTCDAAAEAPVDGDRDRLRALVDSLLENALEATASGSIAVSVGVAGRDIVLELRDSGSGIAPEVAQRLFEPFATTHFLGRGLGLPAARGIAEAHGGTLTLDPGAEGGAVARLVLPRRA